MAKVLKNGAILMGDGRILWGRDPIKIIDICELSALLCPPPPQPAAPSRSSTMFAGGGWGGGGGGRGPQGPQGIQGIQGPPGPTGKDIFAADRIVSLVAADGTDLTIQAAVNNLPPEGGTIFIKKGTYPVSDTISWGDISVEFVFSPGATVVASGLGAKPLFKCLGGLTKIRTAIFRDPTLVGENVAGQFVLALADANSRCQPYLYVPNITLFRNIFDIQAIDVTYTFPVQIDVEGGNILPPGLGTGTLVKSPAVAYTFSGGMFLRLENVAAFDNLAVNYWALDFDGDFILEDSYVSFGGACKANGLTAAGSYIAGATGSTTDSFEFISGSWHSNYIIGSIFNAIAMRAADYFGKFIDCFLNRGAKLIFSAPGGEANGIKVNGAGAAPENPAAVIDFLAGAEGGAVIGGWLQPFAATAAVIRTAAQKLRVVGVTFENPVGGVNTILETGAADYTLVTGCIGISSGAGFSIPGVNSLVGADNIG